ncbi:MAG: hypothetical protein ACYC8T_09990 [Myxococcaceae bacterium]
MTLPPPASDALPRGMRNATVLCLVLAGLVGIFSATEAASLTSLSAEREASTGGSSLFGDPVLMEKAAAAQAAAYAKAVVPMQVARGMTLGALAVAAGLVFVAAGRLIRPVGLPREGMRGLLGGAAMVAAMLRAIDGSQMTVVALRVGTAAGKVMLESEPYRSDPSTYAALPSIYSLVVAGFAVLQTAVVAGGLLALSMYFRSQKVKQIVAFQDKQTRST